MAGNNFGASEGAGYISRNGMFCGTFIGIKYGTEH